KCLEPFHPRLGCKPTLVACAVLLPCQFRVEYSLHALQAKDRILQRRPNGGAKTDVHVNPEGRARRVIYSGPGSWIVKTCGADRVRSVFQNVVDVAFDSVLGAFAMLGPKVQISNIVDDVWIVDVIGCDL